MDSPNPFQNLPGAAFWRTGVVESSPFELDGIYSKKFDVFSNTKIATAGSCFAQHITHRLKLNGFNVLDLEPAPPGLPPEWRRKFGFSMYSARYGNIYTVHQLLQLAREANNEFEPENICWERDGKYFDALRPAVEPEGLETPDEVLFHRAHHLKKVREMLRDMDLFIFTLGLTEAWRHKASQTIYPVAPGALSGTFDAEQYAFANFGFQAVQAAFDEFIEVLGRIRQGRPSPRILLTVSPVPLTATGSGRHVLQASIYSKAVLRAFAGQQAAQNADIDYFPAYEIITNPAARGVFFEENLRSVRPQGVETAMRIFFESHRLGDGPAPEAHKGDDGAVGASERQARSRAADLACEEAVAEAFNR